MKCNCHARFTLRRPHLVFIDLFIFLRVSLGRGLQASFFFSLQGRFLIVLVTTLPLFRFFLDFLVSQRVVSGSSTKLILSCHLPAVGMIHVAWPPASACVHVERENVTPVSFSCALMKYRRKWWNVWSEKRVFEIFFIPIAWPQPQHITQNDSFFNKTTKSLEGPLNQI